MGGRAKVTSALDPKLRRVATLCARPLTRRAKISDTMSHEMGPKDTCTTQHKKSQRALGHQPVRGQAHPQNIAPELQPITQPRSAPLTVVYQTSRAAAEIPPLWSLEGRDAIKKRKERRAPVRCGLPQVSGVGPHTWYEPT